MFSRDQLINIFYDTKEYFNVNRRDIPKSVLINSIQEFDEEREKYPIDIEIFDIDTFDMATEYCAKGLNPLVLNMASNIRPGGGVANGSTAQEEVLFRKSNCHLTHPRSFYPLKDNESIYSPEITIIKDNHYSLIEEVKISMIAVPAIRQPYLINGKYNKRDYDLMSYKIECIFTTALNKGHDSLVLGALGCGVFNNPPSMAANIFKDCIEKYGRYFKKIGFAILVCNKRDSNNLDTFSSTFLSMIKD